METGDDLISNNKMQRLLYYAQGTMLALKNKKLFDDDICAFHYGPAVESVYNEFSKYDVGINKRVNNEELVIDDKTASLLEKVYETFGQFSAGKLTEMRQKEKPFKQTAKVKVIDCRK